MIYMMIEQEIINGIQEVVKINNLNRMPTSNEVRKSNMIGLASAIEKTGGYVLWAEKLNLSPKKPTYKWSDEKIAEEILEIKRILNLDRMPSREEIESTKKNNALVSVIGKTYGFYGWEEKLNLTVKRSETQFGQLYQQKCIQILQDKGYIAEDTSTKAPYDIVVNNKVRIDVKSGCAYDLKGSRCHTFNLEKQFLTCDIYMIFALDENGEKIERLLIIPSSHLNIVTLSMGTNSKYNKYKNRWDYIDKYLNFYKTLN